MLMGSAITTVSTGTHSMKDHHRHYETRKWLKLVHSTVHKRLRETKPPAAHLLRGTSNDAGNRGVIPRVFKVLKRPLLAHQGQEGGSRPIQE